MNEARTVGLVFGAVALITFALAASLVYNSLVLRKRPEPAVQDDISRAFLASPAGVDLPALDRLLPPGTTERTALGRLAADGFACTFETRAATCFRSVGAGRATDIWTIWLSFDDALKIISSRGERRSARL